jgi:hypothetical protein
VLFVGSGGTDLMSRNWGVRVLAEDRFQVPEYDSPVKAYPRFARRKQFDYTLYEFGAPDAMDSEDEFSLDVGTQDDLNVLRFHAKEETEGRTIRWSRDISYVILPGIQPVDRELTIWMSDGGRPDAAPPADVAVQLDDAVLGTKRVDTGFKPYLFAIPPAVAERAAATREPVRIRLVTSTWSPEAHLGVPDDRQLGIMVDKVAVK